MVRSEIIDADHRRIADRVENAVEQAAAPGGGSDFLLMQHVDLLALSVSLVVTGRLQTGGLGGEVSRPCRATFASGNASIRSGNSLPDAPCRVW